MLLSRRRRRGRHVREFDCHQRLEVISKPCEVCQAIDEAEKKSRDEENRVGEASLRQDRRTYLISSLNQGPAFAL
jgi:hypothetical protein